jgi:hypothetical protein
MVIFHHPQDSTINSNTLQFDWVEPAWKVLAARIDFVVVLRWELEGN